MADKQGDKVLFELLKAGIIKNDGKQNIYLYDDKSGVWVYKTEIQIRRYISYFAGEKGVNLTFVEVRHIQIELQEHIGIFCPELSLPDDPNWICARNGIVNLRTLEIMEHDPNKYFTKGIDFVFKKEAKIEHSEVFVQYLQTSLGIPTIVMNPSQQYVPKVKLVLQILLYCLSNLQGAKKAVVFLGEPHTGKSVLIKFIAKLVGEAGYAPLSLEDLSDRFRASLLEHIHLVLSHEISIKGLRNLNILKAIISEEPIIIEAKGKQPKTFTPAVKILMGANSLPVLEELDAGNAFADRLSVLKFGRSVEKRDLNLLEKLYNDRDQIISAAIKVAPDFIKENLKFVEDPDGVNALNAYKAESNSVVEFLHDQCEDAHDEGIYLKDLYEMYKDFTLNNCLRPCTERSFRQQMLQLGYQIRKMRLQKHENPRACVCDIRKREGEYCD